MSGNVLPAVIQLRLPVRARSSTVGLKASCACPYQSEIFVFTSGVFALSISAPPSASMLVWQNFRNRHYFPGGGGGGERERERERESGGGRESVYVRVCVCVCVCLLLVCKCQCVRVCVLVCK